MPVKENIQHHWCMYAFMTSMKNCFLKKSKQLFQTISSHFLMFGKSVLSCFMNQSFLNIRGRALLSRDSTKVGWTLVFNVAIPRFRLQATTVNLHVQLSSTLWIVQTNCCFIMKLVIAIPCQYVQNFLYAFPLANIFAPL